MAGNGSYGIVYKAQLNGEVLAVKQCCPALLEAVSTVQPKLLIELKKYMMRECVLLSEICHPNIARFIGVSVDGNDVSLVMEYIPFTLTKCLDTYSDFPVPFKYRILRDVCHALAFLHGRSPALIHRDLSANNVMLTRDLSAKIIDVGSAISPGTTSATGQMSACPGALVCMPPEAKKIEAFYDQKLDIFSLGIIMIHVLVQKWPIPEDTDEEMPPGTGVDAPEVQLRLEYLQSDKMGEEHPLTGVVVNCLQTDPADRPEAVSLARIIDDLSLKNPASNLIEIREKLTQLMSDTTQRNSDLGAIQQWTRTRLVRRKWTTSNLAVDAIRQSHTLEQFTPCLVEVEGPVTAIESKTNVIFFLQTRSLHICANLIV